MCFCYIILYVTLLMEHEIAEVNFVIIYVLVSSQIAGGFIYVTGIWNSI